MLSRAHLLVKREFETLRKGNLWGIEASQISDDNMFEWTAKILGPKGTDWEGGIFRLYITFDEHYNIRPPEVCFHTIPFHPNVDMITGKPCVNFLDDLTQWKANYSVAGILLTIQVMLANPAIENAVNQEAAQMMLHSPRTYKQLVFDCVTTSKHIEGALSQDLHGQTVTFSPRRKPVKLSRDTALPRSSHTKPAKISFEDYHVTWSGIATSKSERPPKNLLSETLHDSSSHRQVSHYGLEPDELQEQLKQHMKEHRMLMYGNFKRNINNAGEDKQAKLDRLNRMKNAYMKPLSSSQQQSGPAEEEWEEEGNHLVAWSNKLNEDEL